MSPYHPRRTLFILAFAIGLVGCTPAVTVRNSTPDDLNKIKGGKLAMVILQIKVKIDGKSVPPTNAGDSNNSPRLYLASLGDATAPRRISGESPSEAAAVEGWQHILLPPGTYYLLVLPPGMEQNPPAVAFHIPTARFGRLTQYKLEPMRGGFWSPELMGVVFTDTPPQDFKEIPGFWFEVPEGKPVVYIGTLSTACTGGRGVFGTLIDSCSDYDITLDQKAAKTVAAAALLGEEAEEVAPLALYGKARDGVRLRDRGAITLSFSAPTTLDAAYTGALMAPWGVIHGTERAIGIYNLLAIISEASTRASAQQKAEQRAREAQPCMKVLSEALQAIDYADTFNVALTQAAISHGTALDLDGKNASSKISQSGRVPFRLKVSIPILQLRDSAEAQYLSLELGLHIRLEAVDTGRIVYDGILLYTEGFTAQNPMEQGARLYERLVPERAQPRPLSHWCGTNGDNLLRDEIEKGIKHIAAQLIRDLE